MDTRSDGTNREVWQEGYRAYERKQEAGGCPYDPERALLRIAWLEGWLAAHFEAQGRRSPPA